MERSAPDFGLFSVTRLCGSLEWGLSGILTAPLISRQGYSGLAQTVASSDSPGWEHKAPPGGDWGCDGICVGLG